MDWRFYRESFLIGKVGFGRVGLVALEKIDEVLIIGV
jgi:hypothetical protein